MVPAGREACVLDAQGLGALLLEEIERHVMEDGEVLGRVAGADVASVDTEIRPLIDTAKPAIN